MHRSRSREISTFTIIKGSLISRRMHASVRGICRRLVQKTLSGSSNSTRWGPGAPTGFATWSKFFIDDSIRRTATAHSSPWPRRIARWTSGSQSSSGT